MYFVEMMLLSMAEQQLPPQEERANDSSSIVDDVVAGWPELEAAREFQTQLFSREVGEISAYRIKLLRFMGNALTNVNDHNVGIIPARSRYPIIGCNSIYHSENLAAPA